MSDTKKLIGQRLASLRKTGGFTQKQLADAIGVSQSNLSDYENGGLRLHAELILDVCHTLSISADELLGLASEPTKESMIEKEFSKRIEQLKQLPTSDRKALLLVMDKFITHT
jgi:transcriptional regulator with XRE-family HTH domain